TGNSALLPLAVTSRFVGGVALDVLWEKQEDLEPLFKVLPNVTMKNQDVVRMVGLTADGKVTVEPVVLSLKLTARGIKKCKPDEIITDANWKRLKFYASRIRVLEDTRMPAGRVLILDHRLIAAALARGVLFPRLHTLYIGPQLEAFLHEMSVCVSLPDGVTPTASLRYAREDCPPRSLGALFPLANVRALSLEVDPELSALPVLRGLDRLQRLYLSGVGFGSRPFTGSKAATAPGFRTLTALHLGTIYSVRAATLVLRKLSSQPLALVDFTINGVHNQEKDTAEASRDFFAAMQACIVRETLTCLRVTTSMIGVLPNSELLAGALAFPNIEAAGFAWQNPNADIDDAVQLMSEAWPKLRTLSLLAIEGIDEGNAGAPRGPRVSLKSLIPFARRCPNLGLIAFHSLDMTEIPAPVQLADEERLHKRRVTLQIAQSELPAEKAREVAAFLMSVFPKGTLEQISVQTCKDAWTKVVEVIRVMTHGE
ncbi:hypothetical protein HDZ31DRAFT_50168, partial [Schizophyllum fasciatum]